MTGLAGAQQQLLTCRRPSRALWSPRLLGRVASPVRISAPTPDLQEINYKITTS